MIESPHPKENVILKIDIENAFNSINQQFMLEQTFEIHPEVYKYSHLAYSQPSFLFYADSVIKSFSYSIRDLIESLESNTNLWYFNDGNLSDDYSEPV